MSKKIFIALIVVLIIFGAFVGTAALITYKNQQDEAEAARVETERIERLKKEAEAKKVPEIETSVVLGNLNIPWDIVFITADKWIFTERGNKLNIYENGNVIATHSIENLYVENEGGLMGLAIDPEFENNQFIYTCFNNNDSGNVDIRVVRWKLTESNALSDRKDIITGIPSNLSGRHSGCQLEFGPDNALWISTGDAAQSENPQSPTNLGGKILRVDRDGNAVEGNLGGEFDTRIYSYGHRNGQGLAFFPNNDLGIIGINAEHGSDRNDEINPLVGGNFGWDPGPGYDESVPMTDSLKFPDAVGAIWDSGNPTIAISGATVIKGEQWKLWNNAVAFAALKGERVVVVKFNKDLQITSEQEILQNTYGRIRTIQQSPEGNLYILTGNGGDSDEIIKIKPK